MRTSLLLLIGALQMTACGGSSAAPTPPVTSSSTTTTTVPTLQTIDVQACPTATSGVDLGFYRQIGCNAFDTPLQPVRRWTLAPKLYLRTIDEAGAPIDPVTLDTVQNAMIAAAPILTAGRLSISVERGAASREGVPGWITVKWPATITSADFRNCGHAQVAVDGGWIELNYPNFSCGCDGSRIRPTTARHELGHALGYWHTDSPADVMYASQSTCDVPMSARELQAIAYQYR